MRYIYVIRNLVNGKAYVGQTKNPSIRKATHFYNARKGIDRPLYHSIRKHGKENFYFEVLEECSNESINERERHWVNYYDSHTNGYNLTKGGQFEYTPDVQERMKRKHQGFRGKTHTLEARKLIGVKNSKALKGRSLTAEHRANISKNNAKTNLGKTISQETRDKIRSKLVGRRLPLKTREKMSLVRRGKDNTKFISAGNVARQRNTDLRHQPIIELFLKNESINDIKTKTNRSRTYIIRAIARYNATNNNINNINNV